MKLKEIPFGTPIDDPVGYCIYTNRHIDQSEFLEAVKAMRISEVPDDARHALTLDDVRHTRFRPLSPHEAKGWGLTWGVMEVSDGEVGYPVTAVNL